MTAGQNISYPLKVKRWPASKIKEKVFQLAEQMSISHLLHRKPSTLSGGELRRIAIARTLPSIRNVFYWMNRFHRSIFSFSRKYLIFLKI